MLVCPSHWQMPFMAWHVTWLVTVSQDWAQSACLESQRQSEFEPQLTELLYLSEQLAVHRPL